MAFRTFHGGIHPFEGKILSMDCAIKVLLPKGECVYPVSQHIGGPATPIVAVGDRVLAGQKIAEASGYVSSPVISAVSGTVKAIEPRRTANGKMVDSIVIDNDEKMELYPGVGKPRDYASLSKEEILNIIKESGIVGLGGAGFPTHVKLSPKNPDEIKYIIINGAECEPYLTSDYRLLIEEPDKVIAGLKIVLSLFDNARGVIAIEDNKPAAIARMREYCKNEPLIRVLSLKTKYPQGCERMLINAVAGKRINSTMLPADVGCIVDNVDTAVSIYNAVAESTPLMRRIFTCSGDAIAEPSVLNVRIGTDLREIIEACGGFIREPEKLIAGGPMMGNALFDTAVAVTKTSSALTCLSKDQVYASKETACIKCGHCANVCPEHLMPLMMMQAALRNNLDDFVKLNGLECMECGSCTYTCPAKRPLTQSFKTMKAKNAAKKRAEAAAKAVSDKIKEVNK